MAENLSDSQRRAEFTAKWRRFMSRWRRNYWHITNFIKNFRYHTHTLFSFPGQLITDPGLVTLGGQTCQTWMGFIIPWIWAIAGFVSGSVIGLDIISGFHLANNPNVSWFMIGASIAGALIATTIVTLSMMLTMFVVNSRGLQRMAHGYGKPGTGDNFVYAIRDTVIGLIFGDVIGMVIVLVITVALLIHLASNSALITVGFGGGVLAKLGGTLFLAVLIPAIKSLLSSAAIGAIWRFFRGESRRIYPDEDAELSSGRKPKLSDLNKRQREQYELFHEILDLLSESQVRPGPPPHLPGHHNIADTLPQFPAHTEIEPHSNSSPTSTSGR